MKQTLQNTKLVAAARHALSQKDFETAADYFALAVVTRHRSKDLNNERTAARAVVAFKRPEVPHG